MTNPSSSGTPSDQPSASRAPASDQPDTESPAKKSTRRTPKATAKSAAKPAAKAPAKRAASSSAKQGASSSTRQGASSSTRQGASSSAKAPARGRAEAPAESSSRTANSVATVTTFLQALERLDLEAALDLLADDVLYQNVSLPPARGRRAVAKQLGLFARHVTRFRAVNHRIVGDGSTVLTERTDIITVRRFRAEFWVCGTFEVRDGKIVLWRDYFDWANLLAGAAAGAGRALVGLALGLRNR